MVLKKILIVAHCTVESEHERGTAGGLEATQPCTRLKVLLELAKSAKVAFLVTLISLILISRGRSFHPWAGTVQNEPKQSTCPWGR